MANYTEETILAWKTNAEKYDEALQRIAELERHLDNKQTRIKMNATEYFDMTKKYEERIEELELMKNDYIDIINKQDEIIKTLIDGIKAIDFELHYSDTDDTYYLAINDIQPYGWADRSDKQASQIKAMLEVVEVEE